MINFFSAREPSKENIRKTCPECLMDSSMRYRKITDSFVCGYCNYELRELYGQTPLPTEREQESDSIIPGARTEEQRPFIKSIRRDNIAGGYGYESSINPSFNLAHDGVYRYHGSAQDAIKQDNYRRDIERARTEYVEYQRRSGITSDIITGDSDETRLTRYQRERLRNRDIG